MEKKLDIRKELILLKFLKIILKVIFIFLELNILKKKSLTDLINFELLRLNNNNFLITKKNILYHFNILCFNKYQT